MPQQFAVAASLGDAALVHDDYRVSVPDGREPVGDEQGGPALGQSADVPHDQSLALDVEGAGSFIKYEDLRVGHDGSRDGDALALAAGEAAAAFAYAGVVAVRHFFYEFMGTGQFCCLLDLFMGRVRQGDADVLLDGAGEEQVVLQDDADLPSEPGRLYFGGVDAVDENAPLLRQVQALDELRERALSGAGAADDAHREAGRYDEVHILDDAAAVLAVGEADAAQLDLALEVRQSRARRVPGGFLTAVHEVAEAAHGYAGLLEFLPGVDDAHDRGDELARDHLESDKRANGQFGVHDLDGPHPQNEERIELLEEQADGAGGCLELHDGEAGFDQAAQEVLVAPDAAVLGRGVLDRPDAGQCLDLERPVRSPDEEGTVQELPVQGRSDDVQEDEGRQQEDDDEGKPRAVEEQDAEVDESKQAVEQERQEGSGQEVPEGLELAQAGDDVAGLPAIEVLLSQMQDVPVQAAAEGRVHAAGDLGKQVAAQCGEPVLEDGRQEHADEEDVEGPQAAVDEDFVDDLLREQREREAQELQQDGDAEDAEQAAPVFRDDRQEPAPAKRLFLLFTLFQLEMVCEQDGIAAEVVENLLRVPEQWFLAEAWIVDDELELAFLLRNVFEYEVVPLLHLEHGRERELQELLLVYTAQFPGFEVQHAGGPEDRRFVSRSRLHDAGPLELGELGRLVEMPGDEAQAGQTGIFFFLHILTSPSGIRWCSGGRGRGRSR